MCQHVEEDGNVSKRSRRLQLDTDPGTWPTEERMDSNQSIAFALLPERLRSLEFSRNTLAAEGSRVKNICKADELEVIPSVSVGKEL